MAKYNKIKLAINNNNYRLMATYKTTKVAISQYKYIVMAIYKHSKVATTQQKGIDMATYKHVCKPNGSDRNGSQHFGHIRQPNYLLPIHSQQINNVHKNI